MLIWQRSLKKYIPNIWLVSKYGNFYNSYGKDAYIISHLFSYRIKFVEDDIPSCGFPAQKLPKVMAILEKKKINYILIDTRNNYDIDEKEDYKNLNTYEEIFEKAHKSVRAKVRIEKISEELLKIIEKEEFKEKIKKVEEIVYERRKI